MKIEDSINDGNINAIESVAEAAKFIEDSKRADKEAEFQREQLRIQEEVLKIDRQILDAVKAESELKIGNFRNRP